MKVFNIFLSENDLKNTQNEAIFQQNIRLNNIKSGKRECNPMENVSFYLVLRVCDLQKCRTFYRDTLALGAPVLDSPFWVEFQMCDNGKLCLESVHAESAGENPTKAPVWMMDAEEELVEHLTAAGYRLPAQTTPVIAGYTVTAFRDPEGNVFYLTVKNKE